MGKIDSDLNDFAQQVVIIARKRTIYSFRDLIEEDPDLKLSQI